MEQVGFLNLEYLFYTIYRLFSDADITEFSGRFGEWINMLEAIGIALSLVLLVMLIYAKMRASHYHHEILHAREEKMHELQGKPASKNERWGHVMNLMNTGSITDARQAILEADIILGLLLDDLQVPGDSIGEKLKAVSQSHFTTLDLAWEAHRVRNEIAHAGSSYTLTEREAHRIVDLFRRVFEEFDYI
jgi:hypothetical protein